MLERLKKGLTDGLTAVGLAETVESNEVPVAPPQSAPSYPMAPPLVVAPPVQDSARVAKYDDSARSALQEALAAANVRLIPELRTLLATLEPAIPSEPTRYQTALKILSAKAPVAAILSEFDQYVGALEEKNRAFADELKQQFDSRVGSQVKAVEDYDAQIAAAQAQIATLQQQVVDVTQKRAAAQGGIADAQGKLELMQQRFSLQYNAARAQVDQQKAQVVEHGKAL